MVAVPQSTVEFQTPAKRNMGMLGRFDPRATLKLIVQMLLSHLKYAPDRMFTYRIYIYIYIWIFNSPHQLYRCTVYGSKGSSSKLHRSTSNPPSMYSGMHNSCTRYFTREADRAFGPASGVWIAWAVCKWQAQQL